MHQVSFYYYFLSVICNGPTRADFSVFKASDGKEAGNKFTRVNKTKYNLFRICLSDAFLLAHPAFHRRTTAWQQFIGSTLIVKLFER